MRVLPCVSGFVSMVSRVRSRIAAESASMDQDAACGGGVRTSLSLLAAARRSGRDTARGLRPCSVTPGRPGAGPCNSAGLAGHFGYVTTPSQSGSFEFANLAVTRRNTGTVDAAATTRPTISTTLCLASGPMSAATAHMIISN